MVVIAAVLIGLVAGGGGGYFLFNDDGPVSTITVTDNEVVTVTKNVGSPTDDTPKEYTKTVIINMTASQFAFTPNYVELELNTRVTFLINSTFEVDKEFNVHTFTIREKAYAVNVELKPNVINNVTFVVDVPGTFTFECDKYCGDRHNDMFGTMVVSTKDGVQEVEETISPLTELYTAAGNWSNENLFLVIEREARSVAFIDGSIHKIVGRISDVGHQPHTAVFSHDLNYAYVIGRGGWFVKIDLNNLTVVGQVRVGTDARGSAITNDSKYVLISNYKPSSFVIVNTETMFIEREYQIPVDYNTTSGEKLNSRVASITHTPTNMMIVALKDVSQVWVVDMNQPDFPVVKMFRDVGGLLHDAFLSADGNTYFLASQSSNWIWVMDVPSLTFLAKISTGRKPHPGPGAVWGDLAFSPSIGTGKLNVWNTTSLTNFTSINVGGPGLFVRSYLKDPSYDLIWWDTVLSTNKTENYMIHVINGTELIANPQNPQPMTIIVGGNSEDRRSLHPEFTFDGKYVYVSVWEQNGSIAVIDTYTLEIVMYIDGLTTPTGVFNIGLRIDEAGL